MTKMIERVLIDRDTAQEKLQFFVDGKYVCQVNYDEFGWSGMEILENIITQILEALEGEA